MTNPLRVTSPVHVAPYAHTTYDHIAYDRIAYDHATTPLFRGLHAMTTALLQVRNLHVPEILEDLNFELAPGSRLAIIGESGSGKTISALATLQLFGHEGQVLLEEQVLEDLKERHLTKIRGKRISMIFQEPMTALDPNQRVRTQIGQVLRRHGFARAQRAVRIAELLEEVQLPPSIAQRYPHELSGGQRQRILLAMALAANPEVLICDEPTTALDATAQRGIIELLQRLVAAHDMALIFISHDLNVVAQLCTHAIVLRRGVAVERGDVATLLTTPQDPYTQALVAAAQSPLLESAPSYDQQRKKKFGKEVLVAHNVGFSHHDGSGIQGVNIRLHAGQRLGIVGSSGSGKTTLLHLLAGLRQPQHGSLERIGTSRVIFQDPNSSLDPKLTLAEIIRESKADADVPALLAEVGLDHISPETYPQFLSGGQRQRVAIARAIAARPAIVLADEPVSALDMTVRAQVLSMLDTIIEHENAALVMVSHDLAVIQAICDDVLVVAGGQVVETGSVSEIFANPQHQVTKELLQAIPQLISQAHQ
ncbi:MAG: ABC transporter ATP-binding protein [Corynebacterium sp.]|nr:ABC transporter ATP-binding protein [Corynebacterium sp.]